MDLHELLAELAKMELHSARFALFKRAFNHVFIEAQDIRTEKAWAYWDPDIWDVHETLDWPSQLDSAVLNEIAELALDVVYQLKFRAQRPKKH